MKTRRIGPLALLLTGILGVVGAVSAQQRSDVPKLYCSPCNDVLPWVGSSTRARRTRGVAARGVRERRRAVGRY